MPKGNKIDKIEMEKRLRIVQEWIIDDHPYVEIVSNTCREWKLSEPQAKRYIKKARARWADSEQEVIDQKRRRKIETLKRLKKKMDSQYANTPSGIRAILMVEREIAKLENLYPATKIKVGGDPDNPTPVPVEVKHDLSKLSTEELETIVALSKKAVKE